MKRAVTKNPNARAPKDATRNILKRNQTRRNEETTEKQGEDPLEDHGRGEYGMSTSMFRGEMMTCASMCELARLPRLPMRRASSQFGCQIRLVPKRGLES